LVVQSSFSSGLCARTSSSLLHHPEHDVTGFVSLLTIKGQMFYIMNKAMR
jgi:hypothetical protein